MDIGCYTIARRSARNHLQCGAATVIDKVTAFVHVRMHMHMASSSRRSFTDRDVYTKASTATDMKLRKVLSNAYA